MKALTVSEYEVRAVPEVQGTPTWNPIHHGQVIDAIDGAIANFGLGVQHKRFELSTSGGNMFASYRLDQGKNGVDWQIGFRNSVEKRFAVGVTAGNFTVVCSNMIFSGKFVEFRKHTSGLDLEELMTIAGRAITSTVDKLVALETWQEELHQVRLPHRDMRALTFEAMRREAFPPSRFHRFLEAYKVESELNGPTLHAFFGACTRTIRDQSLTQISKRSTALNTLVDQYKALTTG
jgi:hypothetical protein